MHHPPIRTAKRAVAPFAATALLAGALLAVQAPAAQAAGSVVKVTGSQGNWALTVNGSPYTVKGVTWGPSVDDAAKDMPDVASMGVNTIRTWGTDATSKPLFDAAAANGVKVIAGFWLQPGGGPAPAAASTTSPTPRTRTTCSPSSPSGSTPTRTTPAC